MGMVLIFDETKPTKKNIPLILSSNAADLFKFGYSQRHALCRALRDISILSGDLLGCSE